MNKPWLILENSPTAFKDLDPKLQNSIVLTYSAKVKILALRLKAKLPAHIELDDMISAGSLGLMEALDRFDQSQQIRFETYADTRIKGAMLDELRRMDWLSRGMRQKIKKLESLIQDTEQTNGRAPSHKELARLSGYTSQEVAQALEAMNNQFCLNIDGIEEKTNFDLHSSPFEQPFQSAVFNEIIDKLAQLIEQLSEREILVLSLYYADELNMREAAQVMGITEGRISQIHSQAIRKLKKKFTAHHGSIAG